MRTAAPCALGLLLALAGCETSGGLLPDAPLDDDDVAPPAGVLVNELMPANETSILDDRGLPSDWLELHNPGTDAVSVEGWTLSDDWTDPTKHALPDLEIPAGGWLLLWADAEGDPGDRRLPFGLSRLGEGAGLWTPEGESADWVEFPALGADRAWARRRDGSTPWEEVALGTPGRSNHE